MTTSNDPARWEYLQRVWDTKRPRIEQTRVVGWLTLHAEAEDEEDGCREIHATVRGVYVGCLFFGAHPTRPGRLEGAPEVHPDYRRRGICMVMYDWAEVLGGSLMAPSDRHSADAAAFWEVRRSRRRDSDQGPVVP